MKQKITVRRGIAFSALVLVLFMSLPGCYSNIIDSLVNSDINNEVEPITTCVAGPKMLKWKTRDATCPTRVSAKTEEGDLTGVVRTDIRV